MSTENADLQKAGMKSLAAHFKKAASHHDAMAGNHEKCMKAHGAHAEAHEGMMGKANDADSDDKSYHKASAAFHKTMAGHHEKLHKGHSTHAEHLRKMSGACTVEDAKKMLELAEVEVTAEVTPQPVADPPADPNANKAAAVVVSTIQLNQETKTVENKEVKTDPAAAPLVNADGSAVIDLNKTIQSALDVKLNEGVNAGLERVLSSEDFNKKLDNIIAGKLLERLGATTIETEIKTFPVSRPGTSSAATAPSISKTGSVLNNSGVPLDLLDLVEG